MSEPLKFWLVAVALVAFGIIAFVWHCRQSIDNRRPKGKVGFAQLEPEPVA